MNPFYHSGERQKYNEFKGFKKENNPTQSIANVISLWLKFL